MLSQVLFGEKYRVLDHCGHWIRIITDFDNYSGWLDIDHLQNSGVDDNLPGNVLNRSLLCYKENKTKLILEAGCEIYDPDFTAKTFMAGKNKYTAAGDFSEDIINPVSSLGDSAMKFLNSPYIWGGRIPPGIDCSGFTQLVYKISGKRIPRDSWQQAEAGREISFINETRTGDLVFFDDELGRISHVGMILSRGLVIHASGRVRIDTIDHQGIFKAEINRYSHRLRTIRRMLNEQ